MKRLLYILDDGKRSFTYARIAGFCDAINKADEPISMDIFRSAGYAEYDALHNCGEYNIFRLPDFNGYDGIFLDVNSYHSSAENMYGAKGVAYAIRAAAASRKPVIGLANRIADFYYIGIDNRAAMASMAAYLHEGLGLGDFWFLMGPADNYENMERTKALKDYCAEHGLPADEARFHAESYLVDSGVHGFKRLHERFGGKVPQAVICANDPIALGACRAAKEAGLSVPGDLFVTGFDNLDMSAYLSPTITTVDQLRWSMGGTCIDVMQRIWRGEDVPNTTYTPTKIIIRESTGARRPSESTAIARVGESLEKEMATESFNWKLCAMQYRLPGCGSIEEMCQALEKCIPSLKCSSLMLLLDKALYDHGSQIGHDQASGKMHESNDGLHTEGYPGSLELVYSWDEKNGGSFDKEDVEVPIRFRAERGGDDHMFIPLHFMDATIGCLIVQGCVEMLHSFTIAPVVNTMTMALRNYFSGKRLEAMNQTLSGMSMTDNMTGLCNRLGYHQLATQLFRKSSRERKRLAVIFIDMDKMKYFNDTFGHSCGDDAICSVASAIKGNLPKDAVAVRFGGDEFMVLAQMEERTEAKSLIAKIVAALPAEAEKRHMPDIPCISTGLVMTDPRSRLTLDDYVEEADRLMYNDKKARKAGRVG